MSAHVCRPVFDADGKVIGRAQVSPDATDEDMAMVARIVEAAIAHQEARDAADPDGAKERARRQEAARARDRERLARIRGEAG